MKIKLRIPKIILRARKNKKVKMHLNKGMKGLQVKKEKEIGKMMVKVVNPKFLLIT